MPFAAALSEHPLATHAVGEVVGEVLDRVGPAPDLAVLFVGAPHAGAVEDIAGAVRRLLQPRVLIGCTAGTVVGEAREVEDGAAISLWAGRIPSVTAFRLTSPQPPELPDGTDAVIVLADPFTFPADELLDAATVPVVGGMASAARGPGGNRIIVDDHVFVDGGVAVAIGGIEVTSVVSQGCRPIGDPMVVTAGEGSLIRELAGRNALERVQSILQSLSPDDVERARQGLHVGRVIDERKATFDRGDFLVRNLLGADRETGAVAVGDEVEVGATVQLQVRDAESADEDLRQLLAGHGADAALLFTCNGRGTHLFGHEDHDALVVRDVLGPVPIAGMSCAGELGPVGGRSFLHGFTASMLLLSEKRS